MAFRPHLCLIGAGRTGTALFDYLSEKYQFTVIDRDGTALENLRRRAGADIRLVHGDACSALVLEEAAVADSFQVLLAINDDREAGEVIRVLQDRFEHRHITARINDAGFAEKLEMSGVHTIVPTADIAQLMVNRMDVGESFAMYVGKGSGEIMQIQITANSPLANMELKDLPPRAWIIGAIYRPKSRFRLASVLSYFERLQVSREDELIIPKGNTRLMPGDKLLLIGEPKMLRSAAAYLKSGEPNFPRRHGEMILTLLPRDEKNASAHREFRWILSHIAPSPLVYLTRNAAMEDMVSRIRLPGSWKASGDQEPEHYRAGFLHLRRAIRRLSEQKRFGLVIIRESGSALRRFFSRLYFFPWLISHLRRLAIPLWIIRGKGRISRILLVYSGSENDMIGAELAMDCALKFNIPLDILQVTPPAILTGEQQKQNLRLKQNAIRDLAALYGLRINEIMRQGNPVTETLHEAGQNSLLVLALTSRKSFSVFLPDPSRIIFNKYRGSLLVLPA